MSVSPILTMLWHLSAVLAALSFLTLIGLIVRRSRVEHDLIKTKKQRAEVIPLVIGWLNGSRQEVADGKINQSIRHLILDVAIEMQATLRGESLSRISQLIEILGGFDELAKAAKSKRPQKRLDIAVVLRDLDHPLATNTLEDLLEDPLHAVRTEAAAALLYRKTNLTVEEILSHLQLSQRSLQPFHSKVFRAIAETKYHALETLALESPCQNTRMAVAQGLGESGRYDALAPLAGLLEDICGEVRAEAAKALGALGHQQAEHLLIDRLNDEDWRVRSAAIKSLQLIDVKPIALLRQLSARDESWWVRYWADEVLGTMQLASDVTKPIRKAG